MKHLALILLMAVSVRAADALPPDVTVVDMTRGVIGTTNSHSPSDELFTGPVIYMEPEPKPELFPRYLAVLSRYTVINTHAVNNCPQWTNCVHWPQCLSWSRLQTNIQTNHVIGYLAPGEKPWSDLIPVPLWTNFGAITEAIKP